MCASKAPWSRTPTDHPVHIGWFPVHRRTPRWAAAPPSVGCRRGLRVPPVPQNPLSAKGTVGGGKLGDVSEFRLLSLSCSHSSSVRGWRKAAALQLILLSFGRRQRNPIEKCNTIAATHRRIGEFKMEDEALHLRSTPQSEAVLWLTARVCESESHSPLEFEPSVTVSREQLHWEVIR